MQSRACEPEIGRQVRPGEWDAVNIHQYFAAKIAELEPVVGKARLHAFLGNTESSQCTNGVALDDDTDVVHRPFLLDLHEVDVDPGAPQTDRRRESADTSADDENLVHCRHA